MSHTYTSAESALAAAARTVLKEQGIAGGVIPIPGTSQIVAFGEREHIAMLASAPSAQQAAGSIDTGELRRLAEASIQSGYEWYTSDDELSYHSPEGDAQGLIAADHAYIVAANPAAILRLLDALAAATPAQPIAPPKIEMVRLSGNQLWAALHLINPDGPDDEDQCDDELVFGIVSYKDEDGSESRGMCCWNCDTDGVFPLPDVYVAPAQPIAPTIQSAMAYEADDGTIAARRNGELVWHAHIYVNEGDDADAVETAKQVVAALAAHPAAQPIAVSAPTDERAAFEAAADALDIPRNSGVAFKLWQAARAAAPVSGPTPYMWINPASVKREKLTDYADTITMETASVQFGHCTMPLYSTAPVSGQGASIDTPEFRKMARSMMGWHLDEIDEGKAIDALIAYIDSRPRSEDSRAKVHKYAIGSLAQRAHDAIAEGKDICTNVLNALATAPERSGKLVDDRIDILRRALEIIAVGDAPYPRHAAADALVIAGFWQEADSSSAAPSDDLACLLGQIPDLELSNYGPFEIEHTIDWLNKLRRALATSSPTVPSDGMHASIFVKVLGDAGGGDAGRIALAEYAYKLGKKAALAAPPPDRGKPERCTERAAHRPEARQPLA